MSNIQLVQDVVLYPSDSFDFDISDDLIMTPIILSPSIIVTRLPTDIANSIMDACTPKGFNYKEYRQFGQLYSIIRTHHDDRLPWDKDQILQICIALSRLVHPTSISLEYSARIIYRNDSSIHKIIPGIINGIGSAAYSVEKCDWLTPIHFNELTKLIEAYNSNNIVEAVLRAFWYYEYASRIYEVDIRWVMVSTALEAFLHTQEYKSTKQFVYRLQKLAEEIELSVTEEDARHMYFFRSSLAHGQGLGELLPEVLNLYILMEKILRLTLKKAIIEPSFSLFLNNRIAIEKKWPI